MTTALQRLRYFLSMSNGERHFKKFIEQKSKSHCFDYPDQSMILVEGGQTSTNLIALASLVPALKRRYRANACSYYMVTDKNILQKMKNRLKFQFSIMKKITSSQVLFLNTSAPITPQLKKFIEGLDFPNLTKSDFEKLKYRDILVGDLVYDNYLRRTRRLTIELDDSEIINYLIETCSYLDRFLDILSKNNVKAIVVTHMVYNFAIPARIGLDSKIDVFLCNAEVLYRVTNWNYYAYDTHKNYPQLFSRVEKTQVSEYLSLADFGLKSRLMGNRSDLPYFYSPLSPVSYSIENFRSLGGALFVVALHDFSDSPHFFGNCLFPDFYEWLKAIGEFSSGVDAVFLVKPHPNSLFDQVEEIAKIVNKYPKLVLIDSNITNYTLGQMGLNGCLTVYGTIAHEMAYMGIPVINACINNPHASYSFCYTPKSISEWQESLRELAKDRKRVEKTEVLEYYAMNYLYHPVSWIISNYSDFITRVGSYREPDPNNTFKHLQLPEFSYNFDSLQQSIQNFLESSDLRFGSIHNVSSKSKGDE